MVNTIRSTLLLLGGALLVACQLPTTTLVPERTSAVTLTFSPPSRTVGADWAALISTYEVVLSLSSNPAQQVGGTSAPGASFVTLTGVEAGTWDIVVSAKTAGGVLVASGNLDDQVLPQAQTLKVPVVPLASGVGGFAYTLRFPQPPDPIVAIEGQLYTLAGVPSGPAYEFLDSEGEFAVSGPYRSVTFTGSGLAPGFYRLTLTLLRAGGIPARSISEAINIGGGVSSDRWISPDGGVYSSRDLSLSDYLSTVSSLANLDLSTSNLTFTGGAPYSYSGTPVIALKAHSATSTQTLTFTPTLALAGQKVVYSLNSGATWSGILSGTSKTMTLSAGTNVLQLEVTAPDTYNKTLYEISIQKAVDVASVSLISELALPVGATQTLVPTIAPVDATDKGVTWSSSDPSIATVDSSGKVTGIKAGSATITVTTDNGAHVDSTLVTVTGSGTITLSPLSYGVLGFSAQAATINEGDDLTLSVDPDLASQGTGWTAFVQGGSAALSWTTDLVVETSGLAPGQHYVDLFVTWKGVLYSGSLSFVVVSVGAP